MVDDFRRRFWISLALTLPVLATSEMLQHLLGLYGLTLPRYLSVLGAVREGAILQNLGRVRLLCRPFG